MMTDSVILSLSPEVRHQLKLCGITTDAQLAGGKAEVLIGELRMAAKLFPEEKITLSEETIDSIIREAQKIHVIPEKVQQRETPSVVLFPAKPEPANEEDDENEATEQQSLERAEFRRGLKKAPHRSGSRGAITSGHPFTLLTGAFAAVLVPLFMLSLIGIPYLLLVSDYRSFGDKEAIYLFICFALIIPHLIMVRLAHCSVCHMNIFTFRNYPHHSRAHRLPLVGVAVATALRIIFCFRYVCPACGTEQKLFGKRSRHRHTHRS